jgi:hypothetical protein
VEKNKTPLEALDSIRCALSLCPEHDYSKENALCDIIEKALKDLEWLKITVNSIDFIYSLPQDSRVRLLEILGLIKEGEFE